MTTRPIHRWLTLADVAEALQLKSVETVRNLIKTEGLPVKRIGGSIRVLDSDFNQWCEGRRAS